MSKNKLFTFELSEDKDEVEIHFNKDGLQDFIYYLERLLRNKVPIHDHLMTPSWSGTELTEEQQGKNNKLINMVTVYLWD